MREERFGTFLLRYLLAIVFIDKRVIELASSAIKELIL